MNSGLSIVISCAEHLLRGLFFLWRLVFLGGVLNYLVSNLLFALPDIPIIQTKLDFLGWIIN